MLSCCNQYTNFKMFSIGEKWILCYIISGSENYFLKNLYDYGICFDIVGFKEQWIITILWPCVNLIIIGSEEQCKAQVVYIILLYFQLLFGIR